MNIDNPNDIKQKTGRKRDSIRDYYILNDNKLCCTFENCKKSFSSKTSVVSLKNHISKHEQITKNNINTNSIIPIKNMETDEMIVYKNLAIAFAKNSLPHSLIENKYFRNLIECVNCKYKLTKLKLKEFIISEGAQISEDTLNMLDRNGQPITLAIDGWTNVRSNKVTNILLICSGIAYYFCSIENKSKANTADYLVETINEKISFLLKKGLRITSITSDNENVMKLTKQRLNKLYPILIIIPCSAHIIQLCLKSMCNINEISKLINETADIIKSVRNNKDKYIRLYELQKNDSAESSQTEILKLIYPSEIRWTSLILCIQRLLTLKKYIIQITENISENYWENLNDLYILLEPFKKAIYNIQSDYASLYSVWINFNDILTFYKSNGVPKNFKDNMNDIIEIITNKWNKHINKELIESVRLFNLEQNFKYNKKTLDFIVTWGKIYLKTYKFIENNDNDENLTETIKFQLNEFILRHGEFAMINNENEKMKKIYNNNNKKYDIKLLWNLYLPSHFELTNIIISILSICPSEASVERSFSIQSDVHSLERNKLSDELIEAEMNIKMNLN